MSSWNYRVLDFGTYKALHEVYYDDEGAPDGWTEQPATFVCDDDEGPSQITSALAMAAYDAGRLPVLKVVGDKLVSADVVPRTELTPELLNAAIERHQLAPSREIALRVREHMMSNLDDDVIGRITESHVAFGTACAWEALQGQAALYKALEKARATLAAALIANAGGLFDEESVGEHVTMKVIDTALRAARGETA